MTLAIERNIVRGEFFQNAVNVIRDNIVDADGAAQVMTGWSLEFVVRDPNGTAVITKTTSAGITIGDGAGTDTRATITVDVADTSALTIRTGTYTWAMWRTDSTNDVPLTWGTFVITRVAAQ